MNDSIGSAGRHERVFTILKQEIQLSTPGSRLESITALAKRFSVSGITVRHALLLLAKDGLVELKHGSGTFVRECADKRHVGVLLDLDIALPDISFFWRRVVQQVRLGLRSQGYRTRFYAGHCRPGRDPDGSYCADLTEDIADDRLCGLVTVWGGVAPADRELLRQRAVPCISWAGEADASFDLDYVQAIRQAIRYLLQAGRRKLAFLGWSPGCDPWRIHGLMLGAAVEELTRAGVRLNDRWVRCDIPPTLDGAGWSNFREIWTATREKPDSLLVTDDVLFRSAAMAIQELGIRVPEQLLVVTHANKDDGYRSPFPVARMEVDPDAYARATVALTVARLRRQPVAQPHVLLPLKFIAADAGAATNADGPPRERSAQELDSLA